MCGWLLDDRGKSDVGLLLQCKLAGLVLGWLRGPDMGLCMLGLWRAVGVTCMALRMMLARGFCTERLGYGENAGHFGGLYDDGWGSRRMTTVGCWRGHWEEGYGVVGE